MANDVEIKGKVSIETGDLAKKLEDVKKSMGGVINVLQGSSGMFSNLKKGLLEFGSSSLEATKSTGIFDKALGALRSNPIILVITTIVQIIVMLIDKFKNVTSVSDSLGKAWASISTVFKIVSDIFKAFAEKILTPVIENITKFIDLIAKAGTWIASLFDENIGKSAERAGELAGQLNDLEKEESKMAFAREESNRQLEEARAIAADANVPIKERIEALKKAGEIEKKQLEESAEHNRKVTAIKLEQLALEMNARGEVLDMIKKGNVESLKGALTKLEGEKNADQEKIKELKNALIEVEANYAKSAQIQNNTQNQITEIEKEEQAKRDEIRRKAQEEAAKRQAEEKKYLDLRNKLLNEANLAALKDELEIAKFRITNNEKDRIKEVDALKVKEEKKAELRAMIHNASLQEIEKATAEHNKKELEATIKFNDELSKLHIDNMIANAKNEREKEQATLDMAWREKFDKAAETYKNDATKLGAIQYELAVGQQTAQRQLEEKWAKEDEAKRKEKEQKQNELSKELKDKNLSAYELELEQLRDNYLKKIEIVKGNEELQKQLVEQYEKDKNEIRQKHQQQQLTETKDVLGKVTDVIGRETAAGKGLATATALINTYQGATDALRAKSTLPSPFDVVAKIVNVAAVLASGFKAVKAINSVQVPGSSGGGGVPAPITPQAIQTSTSLNASSIQGIGNAASGGNRNFVLATDITNTQERQATLQRAARLG